VRFPALSIFLVVVLVAVAPAGQRAGAGDAALKRIPPLYKGGIAGLWHHDHAFIRREYGEFELLNYENVTFPVSSDSLKRSSWKLVAMGNFLNDSLQFATLARLKGRNDGLLLIMFEWTDPTDSTRSHGVFHHTFIGKESLLLRTKQSVEPGGLDSLEFSCADLDRVCGRAYYNKDAGAVSLSIVAVDPQ
jgi:hypothetical protein